MKSVHCFGHEVCHHYSWWILVGLDPCVVQPLVIVRFGFVCLAQIYFRESIIFFYVLIHLQLLFHRVWVLLKMVELYERFFLEKPFVYLGSSFGTNVKYPKGCYYYFRAKEFLPSHHPDPLIHKMLLFCHLHFEVHADRHHPHRHCSRLRQVPLMLSKHNVKWIYSVINL